MAADFLRVSKRTKERKHARSKPHSFYKFISEVTSSYFCNVLCIRNESVSSFQTQEEEIILYKSLNTSWETLGSILKDAYYMIYLVILIKVCIVYQFLFFYH